MSLVDKLNYLLQTKELIKNAIIAKGVEILESDTFRDYVQKILDIPSGGESIIIYPSYPEDNYTTRNIQDNGGLIDANE